MTWLRCLLVSVAVCVPAAAGAQSPSSGPLPGEAIYPKPAAEVWEQAKGLLRELKFRAEKEDRNQQIFVTQWRSYDPDLLPDEGTLGLTPGDRIKRMQVHLMVSVDQEPARVAVGTVLELNRRDGNRSLTVMGYRLRAFEDWFLEKLDERVGVKHEPLAGTFDGRKEQAARLAQGSKPCTPAMGGKMTPPVKINDVRPIFPAQGFDSGDGVVRVNAWMTEHGTLTALIVANPSPKLGHFESSARSAASLWRFRPATLGGCPIATSMTVTVTYTLR